MIVIAKQTINTRTPSGRLTVELLKHDIHDQFYVYNSDTLTVKDMDSLERAIETYATYATTAANEALNYAAT